MRGSTLLVAIALLLWLLGGAWWFNKNYSHMDCFGFGGGQEKAAVTETKTVPPAPAPKPAASKAAFTIQDGSAFKALAADGLIFDVSGDEPNVPNTTVSAFRNLNSYLIANPDRKLTVEGRYTTDEANNTDFLNLGLARASAVKDTLVALGAKAEQIELASRKVPVLEVVNKKVLNGLRFAFGTKEVVGAGDELDKLKAKIQANPAIMYFATNSANVDITPKFQQDIRDMKTYLNSVPNAKVNVTGHTDNVGNRGSNVSLSQRRAEKVKQYLIQRGFTEAQLVPSGKGPDRPAATNDTPAGRDKNRRVEISLR